MNRRLDGLKDLAAFESAVAAAKAWPKDEPTSGLNYDLHETAMRCWFEAQMKSGWTATSVMQGALMIYGWMPTILEGRRKSDLMENDTLYKFGEALNQAADAPESLDPSFIDYINGSFVGTSKFLHFSFPASFAIWDMNVARALVSRYEEAQKLRRDEIEKANVVAQYQRLIREHCSDRDDANLRDIEVALFRFGQTRAPKASKKKKA